MRRIARQIPSLISRLVDLASVAGWMIKQLRRSRILVLDTKGANRLTRPCLVSRLLCFSRSILIILPLFTPLLARTTQSQTLINDPNLARQSISTSANFPQSSSMAHTSYDPVHDAYTMPRMQPNDPNASADPYSSASFSRMDRQGTSYGYSGGAASTRDDLHFRSATLPRLDEHRRERLQYTPSHELESLSYRPQAHPATQGLHSFRVQDMPQGNDPRTAPYPSTAAEGSSAYTSLPPLTMPTSAPPAEEKAGSKRIVMACHQW